MSAIVHKKPRTKRAIKNRNTRIRKSIQKSQKRFDAIQILNKLHLGILQGEQWTSQHENFWACQILRLDSPRDKQKMTLERKASEEERKEAITKAWLNDMKKAGEKYRQELKESSNSLGMRRLDILLPKVLALIPETWEPETRKHIVKRFQDLIHMEKKCWDRVKLFQTPEHEIKETLLHLVREYVGLLKETFTKYRLPKDEQVKPCLYQDGYDWLNEIDKLIYLL